MKKITITEQVGAGNFAGETDAEQMQAAKKYVVLMEKHLERYCAKNYPGHELTINLSVENVSGAVAHLAVYVDDDNEYGAIEHDVLMQAEQYANEIEQEIYD